MCLCSKLFLALAFVTIASVQSDDVAGVINLNNYTFDKLVGTGKFDVLVKFDQAWAYGDEADQFKEFAKKIGEGNFPSLLIADIGTEEHHDDTGNTQIAARFNIDPEQYPAIRMFHKHGGLPVAFRGKLTLASLQNFVKETLGLYIGMPGCIEPLDDLAREYLSWSSSEMAEPIATAKQIVQGVDAADQENAQYYVDIMSKIATEGIDVIAEEQAKLDEKDVQKQNILASFGSYRCKSGATGCLRKFDSLARDFAAASQADRLFILEQAKEAQKIMKQEDVATSEVDINIMKKTTKQEDVATSEVYINIMKKVAEKGLEYLQTEDARLQRLLGSAVSAKNKEKFTLKRVIMESF